MSKDAQSRGKETSIIVDDYLSILMRLLPEIEKLSPALVANIKQMVQPTHTGKWTSGTKFNLETANAKAEDLLAMAMKSQGEPRTEYLSARSG